MRIPTFERSMPDASRAFSPARAATSLGMMPSSQNRRSMMPDRWRSISEGIPRRSIVGASIFSISSELKRCGASTCATLITDTFSKFIALLPSQKIFQPTCLLRVASRSPGEVTTPSGAKKDALRQSAAVAAPTGILMPSLWGSSFAVESGCASRGSRQSSRRFDRPSPLAYATFTRGAASTTWRFHSSSSRASTRFSTRFERVAWGPCTRSATACSMRSASSR